MNCKRGNEQFALLTQAAMPRVRRYVTGGIPLFRF
jgi:hypothetical protein